MTRYPSRDNTSRTAGPAVNAAGDGLTGAYSAVVQQAPSGGSCKVSLPSLSLTQYYTAICSPAFSANVGDSVLVMFDENKQPWVLSPSGVVPPVTAPAGGVFTYSGGDTITAGSWNFLAHPDRVNNVVVPANSIVYVTYRAHLDKTVGSGSVYAILTCATSGTMTASSFLRGPMGNGAGGNNTYAEASAIFGGQAPAISGVICTQGWQSGTSGGSVGSGSGLTEYGYSGSGDPADTFESAPQMVGTPVSLVMPAGTYDFGVAYDADAGVTASRSAPFLAVDVRSL